MSPDPAPRPLRNRSRAVLVALSVAALLGAAPAAASSAATPHLPRGVAGSAVKATSLQAVVGLSCSLVGRLRMCSHGDDARLRPASAAGEGSGSQTSTRSTRLGCYGDGRSGTRVQAVYARPNTAPDRLATVLPSFRGWAGALEKTVDDSAHQTGGARHLRFATRPSSAGCTLDVISVALPAQAFGSLTATISALQREGLDAKGTKYLVWSEGSGYCGIASMYDDAKPGQDNLNNGAFPTYARIDHRCWGYAEAHELVHMLGGVQRSAPHATAGFHCRDGKDLMCYADGTAGSRQLSTCGSAQAALLDCGHDDYFSTSPPRTSWLSGHWNVATSAFLSAGWTEPTAGSAAPPQPAPQPEPDPEPSTGGGGQPLPSLPPLGR